MNKKLFFWYVLPVAILFTGCKSEANSEWQGNYLYEHEIGEGAGGISSFIEYDLTIANEKCTLNIAGLQIDDHLICKAEPSENAVAIKFKSYADGEIKNPLGIDVYKVDDTLFSLVKDKDSLTTQWKSLVPDGMEKLSGEYFSRINNDR